METQTINLTVSPQGQITIPKAWRKLLSLNQGTQVIAWIGELLHGGKTLVLSPKPDSWTNLVTGSGKGLWPNADNYIKQQREQWD